MRCVFEAMTDGSADYTHACAPTPTPTQLSQTLHDDQILYPGRPGKNNSAAPNISCKEDIQLMPAEEENDDGESASNLSSYDDHASTWCARFYYCGPEQESFRTTLGLPSKILLSRLLN